MKITWSTVLLLSIIALFCLHPATGVSYARFNNVQNDQQKTAELMEFLKRFRQAFLQLEAEDVQAAFLQLEAEDVQAAVGEPPVMGYNFNGRAQNNHEDRFENMGRFMEARGK